MLRRTRLGMSLAEVLVALAIVALLAASLYPAVFGQWQRGQATALANQLENVRDAIANYRTNVQRYPRTLAQLTNSLAATATDACAQLVPLGNRNLWRGPYLTQNVVDSLRVGDAIVLDTLLRNPATLALGQIAELQVVAINVEQSTATELEQRYESVTDFNAGIILYSPGTRTLTFQIRIRNC
jgi:prepilin-type N-terminal cleavage/methylation domain-containing protein